MKTDKNSLEPYMGTLRMVYICAVLLYFMFLTRNALAQTINPVKLPPTIARQQADQQRARVKQIYTSQIGVREKQSNSGTEVEKYLRYVNLPKGNPWCAAFVCWTYGEAGVSNLRTGWSPGLFPVSKIIWGREQGVRNKDQGRPQSGKTEPGARTQESRLLHSGDEEQRTRSKEQRFLHSGLQRATAIPSTGDVFGIYFADKNRIAHVGFIDEWDDPWVITVEGNTNILGSREGDGVYRKRRLVRSVYQVARYIK